MDNRKTILSFVFYVVCSLVILNTLYHIFEPKLFNVFTLNNKKVDNVSVNNELTEVVKNYIENILDENYNKANMDCVLFNKKDDKYYDKIKSNIYMEKDYKIILKNVYEVSSDKYNCYFIITDEEVVTEELIENSSMYQMVIKLIPNEFRYEIIYDDLS